MNKKEKQQAIENLKSYLPNENCKMMKANTKGIIDALELPNPKSIIINKNAKLYASIDSNDETQAYWKGYVKGLNYANNK